MQLLITVDTEWDRRRDDQMSVANLGHVPRFHALCLEYGIRPTYFCTHEVLGDDGFVRFGQDVVARREGEIATHLHPWSTPPFDQDPPDVLRLKPFPHEYPLDQFATKLAVLRSALEARFGPQVSYRAGRFGFAPQQTAALVQQGYRVDSSISPMTSWARLGGLRPAAGPNFASEDWRPFVWRLPGDAGELLEVPVSVFAQRPLWRRLGLAGNPLSWRIANKLAGPVWLRPAPGQAGTQLVATAELGRRQGARALCLMMHSNELDPLANPYFETIEAVEGLFGALRALFSHAAKAGWKCVTMAELATELAGPAVTAPALPRRVVPGET